MPALRSSSNPIVPGFAPDPSVALIDDTYFLVNSSFHVFPGIPVYASKDLVTWVQIGNAINRRSQLSLEASSTDVVPLPENRSLIATGGLYAPTIRAYKGKVYIICTNVVHKDTGSPFQNFYISTSDIWSDNWSDPIFFDFYGIDTSLFFEDDGHAYVQGCFVLGYDKQPSCTIKQFEIDIETGEKLSEEKIIWDGFAKYDTEGPHLYKKDGYYYLLVAEGGTFEHHMLSVSRSTNIWGPYESFEGNPILTADGTHGPIQHTGHGDFFQDTNGLWWAAILGVRRTGDRFNMGRETFLTSVDWPEGGWPTIKPVELDITVDQGRKMPPLDDISKDLLSRTNKVEWVFIRDHQINNYGFSGDFNSVTVLASSSSFWDATISPTFAGKRQRAVLGKSIVLMHIIPSQDKMRLKTGLALYKDEVRFCKIYYDYEKSRMALRAVNLVRHISKEFEVDVKPSETISLRIGYTEAEYQFSFQSGSNGDWETLGSFETEDMTGHDFTGPLIGVYAVGFDKAKDCEIQFENLEVE